MKLVPMWLSDDLWPLLTRINCDTDLVPWGTSLWGRQASCGIGLSFLYLLVHLLRQNLKMALRADVYVSMLLCAMVWWQMLLWQRSAIVWNCPVTVKRQINQNSCKATMSCNVRHTGSMASYYRMNLETRLQRQLCSLMAERSLQQLFQRTCFVCSVSLRCQWLTHPPERQVLSLARCQVQRLSVTTLAGAFSLAFPTSKEIAPDGYMSTGHR